MKRRVMAGFGALARPEGAVEPSDQGMEGLGSVVGWSSESLRPGARPLGRGSGLLGELETGGRAGSRRDRGLERRGGLPPRLSSVLTDKF